MGKRNPAIAQAKQLERAMIGYGLDLVKQTGVPYAEAVRKMNRDPDAVAKKVGASPAFVKVWTDMEIVRKTR
jgi:hypothetical protein